MSAKSEDEVSKVGTLPLRAPGGVPTGTRCCSPGSGTELCELFLAELRMRRARLREWIDMLSQEAGRPMGPAPGRPRTCRGRNRQAGRASAM